MDPGQRRRKCGGTRGALGEEGTTEGQDSWLDPDPGGVLWPQGWAGGATEDSKGGQHRKATDACRWGRGVGGASGSWLGKSRSRRKDGDAVYWEL